MAKEYYVYILASDMHGTLYVGVTSDLVKRTYEHKAKIVKSFTGQYDVCLLVHFEQYPDVNDALQREKTLKRWNRKWKTDLIESHNPDWKDLYQEICT